MIFDENTLEEDFDELLSEQYKFEQWVEPAERVLESYHNEASIVRSEIRALRSDVKQVRSEISELRSQLNITIADIDNLIDRFITENTVEDSLLTE
jgi:SMC interacting uncharacterized protein involved in chromosome segregation